MVKNKTLMKIWVLVIIIWMMSFSDLTFAAAEGTEALEEVSKWIYLIVNMLSWIWVFFAQWASEFLTNKWIYWEVIWLDAVLWKLWNVMKNIASFWLWFYFIYKLFGWLIKWEIEKNLKKVLLWILVAWVWIQASWFGVAVVLDISTITLVAAGSLSSQVVSLDETTGRNIFENLHNFIDDGSDGEHNLNEVESRLWISLFSQNRGAYDFISVKREKLDDKLTAEQLMDLILPNEQNLSWPLYYLWFFILNGTKISTLNSTSTKWFMATIFNVLIQWWTIVVYSLEMIVLFVVAIMRVLFIWVFIVLSPVIILLWCISQASGKWWWDGGIKFLEWFTKHFNIKSFFWNAFKPTIIVLWFSLTLIFVSLMSRVVTKSESFEAWWMNFTSIKQWNEKYTTMMDGDLLSFSIKNAWKTILEFIVSIITVVLVYFIIKMGMTIWGWKDFVSEKTKKLQEWIWSLVWSVPLVPVKWYDKNWIEETHFISAWKVFGAGDKSSLLTDALSHKSTEINQVNEEHARIVDSMFGKKTEYLSTREMNQIRGAGSGEQWLDILKEKKSMIPKTEDGKWMTLDPATSKNNGFWIDQFKKRLTDMKDKKNQISWDDASIWVNMIERWNEWENNKQGLDQMFKKNKSWEQASVGAYARLFGLNLVSNDWEHLKNADISKK